MTSRRLIQIVIDISYPHCQSFKKSWPVNTETASFSETPVIICFTWHISQKIRHLKDNTRKRVTHQPTVLLKHGGFQCRYNLLRYDGKYSSNSCCQPSVLCVQLMRVDTIVIHSQQTDTITRNWVHNQRAKRRPNDTHNSAECNWVNRRQSNSARHARYLVTDKNITSHKPIDSVSRLTCMETTCKRVNMLADMLDMTEYINRLRIVHIA